MLRAIANLELKARLLVEGYMAGEHKSPYRGFAIEFAQHREYAHGDDLRHLDWKVLGRTDRYYIKQYEQETNYVAHMLVEDMPRGWFAMGLNNSEPDIEYVEMPESIRGQYQYFTQAKVDNLRRAGYNADFTRLEDAVGRYVTSYLDADRYR